MRVSVRVAPSTRSFVSGGGAAGHAGPGGATASWCASSIAADGGLGVAVAIDLDVDIVVGDFDSVDEHQLAAAAETGRRGFERHPCAKDATDPRGSPWERASSAWRHASGRRRLHERPARPLPRRAYPALVAQARRRRRLSPYIDDAGSTDRAGGGWRSGLVPAPVGATVTLLPAGGAAVGRHYEGPAVPAR